MNLEISKIGRKMTREEKIKQTQHNMFIVSGLQMYGYELSLLLEIIEVQMGKEYVGIDEIESILLIHTLAFEKILKIAIVAVDSDITEKKLKKLGHSIKGNFQHLVNVFNDNNLCNAVEIEISKQEFMLFMDILEELATIKRRYDKLDLALGKVTREKGIIDDRIDFITPNYRSIYNKTDKEILEYIYVNTLVFIYIIELVLGEVKDGLHQQSLVSLFDMKYRLTVFSKATIDRKLELLHDKKNIWKNLLI